MDRTYKVAVVAACPFPYPRGTPTRILRMAEGLTAHGHDVHVFSYHIGQKIEDIPFTIHRIPNIPTYQKTSPGPAYQKLMVLDPLLALKIYTALKRERFDVIHAHHYEGILAALPAARLLKIPLVFDVHTRLSSELPHYPMGLSARWLQRFGEIIDRWLPDQADHIVSVTNLIRDRLINEVGIAADKITTVYGGIEADYFTRQASPAPESTSRTLIYTGNLAPYQGVELMLHAFRKVIDQRPNVQLKLVTNSSIKPYAGLIAELGIRKNILLENADYFQLPAQLHSADIALHPRTQCDGLPLKLLNYMATGRAIVSFEGSAEVLAHEQTGLIVPDHDIEAFANAIINLVDHPQLAEQLGKQAQSHVNEFFVWEKSIRILEEIYRTLVVK